MGRQKKPLIKIGVDLMGSDHAPSQFLDAILRLKIPEHIQVILIGKSPKKTSLVQVIEAEEVIEMDENPLSALRKKKNASLVVGMRLLNEEKIDAFISAGNTGALVSAAKMIVGMQKRISRPALIALMPTKKKPIAVLDLGANIEAKAKHLIEFAKLGAGYQMARGIEKPKVGILNIGAEAVKGTSELRAAYLLLERMKNAPFTFVGNVEGKRAFDGDVDVLVTDGFTGNIFLKTAEGLANLILDRLHTEIPNEILKKIQPELDDLQKHLHYGDYPGALIAGIQKIAIKCHGYSTPEGFAKAILAASALVERDFNQTYQNQLDKLI